MAEIEKILCNEECTKLQNLCENSFSHWCYRSSWQPSAFCQAYFVIKHFEPKRFHLYTSTLCVLKMCLDHSISGSDFPLTPCPWFSKNYSIFQQNILTVFQGVKVQVLSVVHHKSWEPGREVRFTLEQLSRAGWDPSVIKALPAVWKNIFSFC